jgi:hypothetical protein
MKNKQQIKKSRIMHTNVFIFISLIFSRHDDQAETLLTCSDHDDQAETLLTCSRHDDQAETLLTCSRQDRA